MAWAMDGAVRSAGISMLGVELLCIIAILHLRRDAFAEESRPKEARSQGRPA
jgi:hypothetical protein